MHAFQEQFIRFSLDHEVLKFGEFTLKSGRISPYFFNAGLFNDGESLSKLAGFYAQTLIEHHEQDFMLYGPAYKGIPLAAATAMSLSLNHHLRIPYAFNRKEIKDHGEGGQLIGAPLQGRVIIVDDVITAGISVGESVDIINAHNAQTGAVLIGLDRQEKTEHSELSAVMRINRDYGIPVYSVINMALLIEYLTNDDKYERYLPKMHDYQAQYGARVDA